MVTHDPLEFLDPREGALGVPPHRRLVGVHEHQTHLHAEVHLPELVRARQAGQRGWRLGRGAGRQRARERQRQRGRDHANEGGELHRRGI